MLRAMPEDTQGEGSPTPAGERAVGSNAGAGAFETTITLETLCARLGSDLNPVVGAVTAGVRVSAVHVSELPDPRPYLAGGELLLTTGLKLPRTRAGSREYVLRLREAAVAGIGLGLGPRFDSTPAPLAAACIELGVPLLVVPGPTPFLAITKAFGALQTEGSTQRLQSAVSAQQALIRAATSSEDPATAILEHLGRSIGGWAALLHADGAIRHVRPASAASLVEELRPELNAREVIGVSSAASHIIRDQYVAVFPLSQGTELVGQLAVGTTMRLRPQDRQMIPLAVSMLGVAALDADRSREADDARRGAIAALVDVGDIGAALRLASALGVEGCADEGRVILVKSTRPRRVWTSIRLVLPGAFPGLPSDAPPWILDLGPERPNIGDVGRTLREADPEAAVLFSRRARLNDLGAIRTQLAAAADALAPGQVVWEQPPTAMAAHVDRAVDRLLDDEGPDAAQMLGAYLRHHGHWGRVSSELSIHRNTLRYRLGRLREILDLDIDAPDEAALLWLTLRARGVVAASESRPLR